MQAALKSKSEIIVEKHCTIGTLCINSNHDHPLSGWFVLAL